MKIEKYLKENDIKFINQKTSPKCKGKIKFLPFDFYLPEHNICIEYDGEQHSKPKSCFGGTIQFQKTQHNDNIKTQYCKDNNIELLRIPYTNFNNIETILNESIM